MFQIHYVLTCYVCERERETKDKVFHYGVMCCYCVGGGAGVRGRGGVGRGGGLMRGVGGGYLGGRGYGGVMRPDKTHNRYNPIGMGGGYNMYNWN